MFLVDSIDLDVLNPVYIYCFGIAGIIIYLLLIILAIVFIKKDVDLNYVFGYRTPFALSSVKKWKWANNIFMKCLIIVFTLSAVFSWFFLSTILTMVIGLFYFIPIVLYIGIYGLIKFKNDVEKPIEPLIENEQSKKQDIDDYWK